MGKRKFQRAGCRRGDRVSAGRLSCLGFKTLHHRLFSLTLRSGPLLSGEEW